LLMCLAQGNESKFLEVFAVAGQENVPDNAKGKAKTMEKTVARLMLAYDEGSLSDRKERTRGFATVDQLETVYIVTKAGLQAEKRDRLKFQGTSAGSLLGPVVLPTHACLWNETFARKKDLLGPARVAVGGRTPGSGVDVGEKGVVTKREPDDMEPVFFHSKGEDVYAELLHMLGGRRFIKCVIDLTVGDGSMAHLCAVQKIPFIGYGFTDFHVTFLRKHTEVLVWKDFKEEGHRNYKPSLAAIIEQIGGEPIDEDEDDAKKKGTSKAKGKAKSKAKAKGKGKAKSKAAGRKPKDEEKDDEENEEETEDSGAGEDDGGDE